VRATDVVLVCLSSYSVTAVGYLKREIGYALDAAEQRTDDTIFLIPVRLALDPIAANHIDIVKPKDRDDPRYMRFASALRKSLSNEQLHAANVGKSDESLDIDREKANVFRLTAMIWAEVDGAPSIGTGMICAAEKGNLYLVTANHVIRRGPRFATEVTAELDWLVPSKFRAVVVPAFSSELALAVLRFLASDS